MPWWTTLLIALGGILLGGAYSTWQNKAPLWLTIGFIITGIMAILAGFLLV